MLHVPWLSLTRYSFLQLHLRFTLERKKASSDFYEFQLFSVTKSQCLLHVSNRMTEISIFRFPYKSLASAWHRRATGREALYGSPPLGQILAFRWSCTWNAFKDQCRGSLAGFGVSLLFAGVIVLVKSDL